MDNTNQKNNPYLRKDSEINPVDNFGKIRLVSPAGRMGRVRFFFTLHWFGF